jgi:hypothetical protein
MSFSDAINSATNHLYEKLLSFLIRLPSSGDGKGNTVSRNRYSTRLLCYPFHSPV